MKKKQSLILKISSTVSGFTLIEIIMVIVIIGILVTLAMPRFEAYHQIKLQGAAKNLVSHIRYTQSIAVSRHEDYALSFDIDQDVYQIYRVSDQELAKDPFTRTDLIIDFKSDSQYQGIDIDSVDFEGLSVLRFNWEGVPQDENGNSLISQGRIVLHYRNRSLIINVSPQTGRGSLE